MSTMNQTVLNRARKDKFLFVMDLPNALKNLEDPILQESYSADPIQFTIIGSPVPKIRVPSREVPYCGQVYNTSSFSRPTYGPYQVKFLLDNGYQNYWILWNWLNLFNDATLGTSNLNTAKNNLVTNPTTDYATDFSVFTLDEFNNKIMSFKYTLAHITELSEFEFNYQDSTEITCTATFVFNQLQVQLLKNVNIPSC